METRVFHDPERFLQAARPYLEDDPFTANVIAVYARGVVEGRRAGGADDIWMALDDGGEVRGLAMHTPPFNLFLSRMPLPAVVSLARSLAAGGRRPPGVSGESQTLRAFTRAWAHHTGCSGRPVVCMRMYRLATLTPPDGVPGRWRPATAGDVPLVARWLGRFHDEAEPQSPRQDWPALVQRRVEAGEVVVWESGGDVVSMAGVSPPALGVCRVGPVYTPPSRRRRGFAGAVTAAASAAGMRAGARHVVLYTDLSNPTSNRIYRSIGYQAHHDAEQLSFE